MSDNAPGSDAGGTPQGVPDIKETPEFSMALMRLGCSTPEEATDVEVLAAAGLAYAAIIQRDGAQLVSQLGEKEAEQRLEKSGLAIPAADMDPQWRERAKAVGLDGTNLVVSAAQLYPDLDLPVAMAKLRKDLSNHAARSKKQPDNALDDGWDPARMANWG